MKIWLLPIESLDQRYTAQWRDWWVNDLIECGLDVTVIDGENLTGSIEVGEFLDVFGTHFYKATQIQKTAALLMEGAVKDDDVFLLLDAWSPIVTSLGYIRDAIGARWRIAGYLHAGTWDPWDYLALKGMGRWAANVERGWIEALDLIFVGSMYHRDLLRARRGGGDKTYVVGCPIHADGWRRVYRAPWRDRARRVVFPHRLAVEKSPQEFDVVRDIYEQKYGQDGVTWFRTKDRQLPKDDYLRLLGESRAVVSTAQQETFGIAMVEGAIMGCYPIAPNRLAYPETLGYEGIALYSNLDHAAMLIKAALDSNRPCDYDARRYRRVVHKVAAIIKAGA